MVNWQYFEQNLNDFFWTFLEKSSNFIIPGVFAPLPCTVYLVLWLFSGLIHRRIPLEFHANSDARLFWKPSPRDDSDETQELLPVMKARVDELLVLSGIFCTHLRSAPALDDRSTVCPENLASNFFTRRSVKRPSEIVQMPDCIMSGFKIISACIPYWQPYWNSFLASASETSIQCATWEKCYFEFMDWQYPCSVRRPCLQLPSSFISNHLPNLEHIAHQ